MDVVFYCVLSWISEKRDRVKKGTSMSDNFLWRILKRSNMSALSQALLRVPCPRLFV